VTVRELHAESRRLPPAQAAELIDLLLVDTFTEPDPAVERAWLREALRRDAEMESGKVKGIKAAEVFARARKKLAR
jgi:Putative addiction module component